MTKRPSDLWVFTTSLILLCVGMLVTWIILGKI